MRNSHFNPVVLDRSGYNHFSIPTSYHMAIGVETVVLLGHALKPDVPAFARIRYPESTAPSHSDVHRHPANGHPVTPLAVLSIKTSPIPQPSHHTPGGGGRHGFAGRSSQRSHSNNMLGHRTDLSVFVSENKQCKQTRRVMNLGWTACFPRLPCSIPSTFSLGKNEDSRQDCLHCCMRDFLLLIVLHTLHVLLYPERFGARRARLVQMAVAERGRCLVNVARRAIEAIPASESPETGSNTENWQVRSLTLRNPTSVEVYPVYGHNNGAPVALTCSSVKTPSICFIASLSLLSTDANSSFLR